MSGNAAGAKVGPFVGYNYYTQAIEHFGCTQVAGSTALLAGAFPRRFWA